MAAKVRRCARPGCNKPIKRGATEMLLRFVTREHCSRACWRWLLKRRTMRKYSGSRTKGVR